MACQRDSPPEVQTPLGTGFFCCENYITQKCHSYGRGSLFISIQSTNIQLPQTNNISSNHNLNTASKMPYITVINNLISKNHFNFV